MGDAACPVIILISEVEMATRPTNTGAVIVGSLMILFGALALLGQVFRTALNWGVIWPLVVIAAGAAFFVVMLAGGRSAAAFAIPGSILGVIGLMLLYQSLTGHWESWAYGWTVIVMSVGIGITIMGLWGRNSRLQGAGLRVLRVGLILLVVFGTFFELIFYSSGHPMLQQYLFPGLLILVGVYLVLTRIGLLPAIGPRQSSTDQQGSNEEASS
jgi:hypothetical protein